VSIIIAIGFKQIVHFVIVLRLLLFKVQVVGSTTFLYFVEHKGRNSFSEIRLGNVIIRIIIVFVLNRWFQVIFIFTLT
jgi:hypothetical protein